MKIYLVLSPDDRVRFHAYALKQRVESHYHQMTNGNYMAVLLGNITHEEELVAQGFSSLPPLDERDELLPPEIVAMFPEDLGITPAMNTYQACKQYSEQAKMQVFHPRR